MKIPESKSADMYNPQRQNRMSKFERKAHMEKPSSKQTEKPIIITPQLFKYLSFFQKLNSP
jgi:hypothetical protein